MKTTWTLASLTGGALVWGGIVAQPWAVGQQPDVLPPTPAPAPTPVTVAAPALPFVTVDDQAAEAPGAPSNPFGQGAYSVTIRDHGDADPTVAKARQVEQKLQRQAREFVAKYASTEDTDARAKIKSALNELLTQQFELQKEVREKELSRLEEKVRKLRSLLDKRSEQREEIVKRRVDQLLIEADGLGWSESPGGDAFGGYWQGQAYYPAPAAPPVAELPTLAPATPPPAIPPRATGGIR